MSRKFSFLFLTAANMVTLPLLSSTEIINANPEEAISLPKMETPATIPFHPFTGRVIGSKVRMRCTPSLEGHVIRETSTGEMFAVEGLENDFYAVRPSKGTKGYVFRTYILDGVVEAERVNVRLSPEMDSPVIGRLRMGDKVNATVSASNSKWFEIDLPSTSRFYIAKEYLENIGPSELLVKMEERHSEGQLLLNGALLYGKSEIQKPFEEIDLNSIQDKFEKILKDFVEFPDITEKAKEANHLLEETFVQKKIAFLESKAERTTASTQIAAEHIQKLSEMAPKTETSPELASVGQATSKTLGLGAPSGDPSLTDKMLVWKPLEESIYQLWATTHEGQSMEDFYKEESLNAIMMTGIIEPYTRPGVKNRPGDFILKSEHQPVAFLYSTKINLQELVGKKITVVGAERPNNHFAFPAYFVLSVE